MIFNKVRNQLFMVIYITSYIKWLVVQRNTAGCCSMVEVSLYGLCVCYVLGTHADQCANRQSC